MFSEDGTPFLITQAELTGHKFNPVFRDDEFSLDFPQGTVVSDARPLMPTR